MPRERSAVGPPVFSEEWRRRVSAGVTRWHAVRREMARVAPSELLELERSVTVSQARCFD